MPNTVSEYSPTPPGHKGNARHIVTEEIGEGHTHSIECFGGEDVLF